MEKTTFTIKKGLNRLFGIIIHEKEKLEIQYLLKREMDEILYDLEDERIDHIVKRAMKERYKYFTFSLFTRVAPHNECMNYIIDTKNERKNVEIKKLKGEREKRVDQNLISWYINICR